MLVKENEKLNSTLSEKDSIILELNIENDILEEGISIRESEISYWGQKCDSLQEK
jgi:predicted nuclease with TOPRIM domain